MLWISDDISFLIFNLIYQALDDNTFSTVRKFFNIVDFCKESHINCVKESCKAVYS
jgi:hypothetical protein